VYNSQWPGLNKERNKYKYKYKSLVSKDATSAVCGIFERRNGRGCLFSRLGAISKKLRKN
jgi:hypothetical protein